MSASSPSEPAPRLFSLAGLRRRGWILPLVVACAAAVAYAVAASQPTIHTAESIAVVNSGADRTGPGAANDSVALARTYAAAIPVDGFVLRRVARAVRRPVSEVESRVTVLNDAGTSILRLEYSDDISRRSIAGATALAVAVARAPRASAFRRGSVRVVHVAKSATAIGGDTQRAVPIGAVLGLMLGLVLMLAWERSDARVDDEEMLRDSFPGPASDLRGMSPAAQAALLHRWRDLAGNPQASIAVIAASRSARKAAARVAEEFGGPSAGLAAAGPPGGPDAAEHVAVDNDAVVLALTPGTPQRALRRTRIALEQFDRAPIWAVIVARRRPFRSLRAGPSSPSPALRGEAETGTGTGTGTGAGEAGTGDGAIAASEAADRRATLEPR